jgi:hypothetical protein
MRVLKAAGVGKLQGAAQGADPALAEHHPVPISLA